MSRDYKTPPKPARSRGSPMLVGLVIGLLIGLAIALGVALYINKVPAPFLPKEQPHTIEPVAVPEPAQPKAPAVAERKHDTPPSASPAAGPEGEKPSGKPRFEFYGILAGKEEAAKEKDVAVAPKDEAAPAETYYLQLAALQDPADADNLKAELALAGIEAKIQTAELPDGKTWHRVRLGPFTSVEAIDEARARLKATQRTATLIKVKEKRAP
jgi:cell division protein FtsN